MAEQRDPYDVLGVPRNAFASTIKSAYRERAKQLHPDVTQNDPVKAEEFKQLVEDYDLLMNAEHRAEYDRTGIRPSSKVNQRNEMTSLIAQLFSQLLAQVQGPLSTVDVLGSMKKTIELKIVEIANLVQALGVGIQELRDLQQRVRVIEGAPENIFFSIIQSKITDAEKLIAKESAALQIWRLAENELALYENVEQFVSGFYYTSYSSSASTTNTWSG